ERSWRVCFALNRSSGRGGVAGRFRSDCASNCVRGRRHSSAPLRSVISHSEPSGSNCTSTSLPFSRAPACPLPWYSPNLPLESTLRVTAYSARCAATLDHDHSCSSPSLRYSRPECSNPGCACRRDIPARYGYSSRCTASSRSSRDCNSATLPQLSGSAHRCAVSWLCSTTPLCCGRRGAFQCISTPKPISHNAKGGGRSLHDPHGLPLSTFILRGIPQRAKQSPRLCCTWPVGTWLKCPRGGSDGHQHRPGGLVGQTQPGDVLPALQGLLLDGVLLPGVVRQAAARRLLRDRSPRRRRWRGQAREQPLDGAFAGRGLIGQQTADLDADASGSPARPILAEADAQPVPGQVQALLPAAPVVV